MANTDVGIFLTTSSFSSSAERTVDELSAKLNLVDGEDLYDIVLELENPQQLLSEYIETSEQYSKDVESAPLRDAKAEGTPEHTDSGGGETIEGEGEKSFKERVEEARQRRGEKNMRNKNDLDSYNNETKRVHLLCWSDWGSINIGMHRINNSIRTR
jgi:hypothetical protein